MPSKKTSRKLNGSADKFAQAFRDVVSEAVEPVREDIEAIEDMMVEEFDKVNKKIDKRVDNAVKNNQSQFAEVNRRLGKIEKTISKRN